MGRRGRRVIVWRAGRLSKPPRGPDCTPSTHVPIKPIKSLPSPPSLASYVTCVVRIPPPPMLTRSTVARSSTAMSVLLSFRSLFVVVFVLFLFILVSCCQLLLQLL